MNKTTKSFLVRITVLTLIIALIGFLLFFSVIPQYYLNIFPITLFFFFVTTAGAFFILHSANNKRFGLYSARLTMVIMLKMFLFLTFIIAYAITNKENAVTFVCAFFGMYLVYSVVLNKALVDLNDSNKEVNQ